MGGSCSGYFGHMTYHIARGGQQIGTVAEEEIRSGLATGRFQSGDLCWAEGMTDWQPVGSKFAAAPAASPSMPPPVRSVNPYAAPQSQVLSTLPGLTPASRGSRFGACLLDGLTGILGIGIPLSIAIFFMVQMENSGSQDVPAGAIAGFVLAGLAFLGLTVWNIVLLTTRGQTLGRRTGAVSPGHQLVGLSGHGRDHHGDLLAGRDFSRHQPRDAPDPLKVGHRGAAEFHHQP